MAGDDRESAGPEEERTPSWTLELQTERASRLLRTKGLREKAKKQQQRKAKKTIPDRLAHTYLQKKKEKTKKQKAKEEEEADWPLFQALGVNRT
ncbi:hypothetical protein TRV_04627 [Trichophyton verrucosum HKI 0517]|uniref:Uncharacterized protein n=1 Tax=Trichophyton verrucosum (strain HKI 0517) TaxID=663202 RepID=D4DBX6_TRIVH|nr:uncharacterized protein TRV_04627 [Trichophyton verrucosum HKI 0517]EFE40646.1 hypothetical protein TRV_04627 [Trichophyton verrucosum HKI 0517]